MTTITLPTEIPHEALRIALANLGLVLDGRVQRDGSHRAVWAEDALRRPTTCEHDGCRQPATVKVGARVWCAGHALAAARESAAI